MLPPIYSRRRRQAQSAGPDVYVYDAVPSPVRIQVNQMLADGMGSDSPVERGLPKNPCYYTIVKNMRREKGVHNLCALPSSRGDQDELLRWLLEEKDVERWLDGVEMSLRCIDDFVRKEGGSIHSFPYVVEAEPDIVIAEFNARLQEAAIGYQYTAGEIVRIDSTLLHTEVVLPTLKLLSDPRFVAADGEYRAAHEAYRHGELEDCLVDCGKALESVLKIIGALRGWQIGPNDPASKLIQAGVDAGFLAAYSQPALNHLKGLIESSTPTIRNKMGGHGAGVTPRIVSQHLAAFQLHQTAAVMLYLMEHNKSLP